MPTVSLGGVRKQSSRDIKPFIDSQSEIIASSQSEDAETEAMVLPAQVDTEE